MHTVYKYPLGIGAFELTLTRHAQVLCVQMQDGAPHMWVRLDPSAQDERRQFRFIGTGHPVPESALYIGTVQWEPFVWHLFELFE